MTKTETSLNGVHYVFYGPNATLITWIKNSDLARTVMDASGLELETLFRAFSKTNPEDQMQAGKQTIGQLWHACPEFGPYPFLDTLSDFEFTGKFYPDYREHVSHQLRVFWLGLYLFDTCQLLKDQLLKEAGSRDDFIQAWRACAIYHDIGYVFENEGANEPSGEAWDKVREVLDAALKAPLSMIPKFSSRLTREVERRVINSKRVFRPEILAAKDVEIHEEGDLLDRIAEFGLNAGLSAHNENGKSPFRRYYDYAFMHRSGNRPRFRDHGIAGALLLLRIWSDFRDYVNVISNHAGDPLLKPVLEDIRKLADDMAACETTITRAAGAMALHNITPSLWDPTDSLANGLTLHKFKIRLLGDDPAPSPMAFLLGLADTLQTWDRPKFRAMRTHDTPGLSDQDMQLGVEDNKIILFFREDDRFKEPGTEKDSLFAKTCENLKEYLDKRAIDDLLQCGECVIQNDLTEESEPETPEPEPPRPPALPKIQLAKLPVTGEDLFGREKELKTLDEAWQNPNTTILTLVAFGGVGKTSLVNHWLNRMGRDNFRGAGRVYGWSFYSQGAKEGTQASADEFFAQALEWFGDPDPAQGSPWERGLRLAGLVRESHTLLILDGLEPIQYPPGPMQGRLKDQGLQALTRELRQYNPGLLVITTRVAVEDIADVGTVKRIDLENLSEGAGARLLEKLGVKRSPDERKAAVREFGGHALALNLLGRFISVVYEGDIRKRDIIGDLTEEVKHGGHARRVMASYDIWFEGTPEHGILHLMGLFDRPAVGGAIRVLQESPAIPGLTDKLENLSNTQWQFALQHLRDLRLLANKDEHRPDTLDCHPLVREHFGEKLRHEKPEAWKQAHSRLYDYFRALPEKAMPDTLEEMEPLFAAVAHGCLAGRFQEVHEEVIAKRIRRGDDYYIRKQLGAIGSWISVLSNFFNEPWRSTVTELNDSTAAEILNNAGYALFAAGRLRESVQPMQAALESHVKQKNWEETTKDATNLSEILLSLGEVARAVEYGRQSVEFAERSGGGALKEISLATLANALYQQGSLSEAESLFIEAENHLKERQPEYFYIYGRQGYRYCDLLLRRGRHGEVRERSEKTLGWARQGGLSLLALALDNLSIGKSFLLQAVKEKTDDDILNVARKYLDRAVEGLRVAGQLDN